MILLAVVLFHRSAIVADDVPVSAGESPDAFVEELQAVASAWRKDRHLFDNVRIKGRTLPRGEQFTICMYDGKRRLDLEVHSVEEGVGLHEVHRLNDGQHYYLLNHESLAISPLDDPETKWRDSLAFYYGQEMPFLDEGLQTVGEFCDWLGDAVRGTGPFQGHGNVFASPNENITIGEESGLIVLRYHDTKDIEAEGGRNFVIKLDPSRNCQMVHLTEYVRSPPTQAKDWVYRRVVNTEYTELLPGVFFPKRGTATDEQTGTLAKEQNSTGLNRNSMEVDSVEFGSFDVPDGYFTFASLSVRQGFSVRDERVSPPASYIYGEAPLSQTALEAMVAEGRELPDGVQRGSGAGRMLLICNGIGVLLMGIVVIVMRMRRSK